MHIYTVTSKHTKVNAVMSAKTTDDNLQLATNSGSFVRRPGSSPLRIEVLHISVAAVDVDRNPVTTRAVSRRGSWVDQVDLGLSSRVKSAC